MWGKILCFLWGHPYLETGLVRHETDRDGNIIGAFCFRCNQPLWRRGEF